MTLVIHDVMYASHRRWDVFHQIGSNRELWLMEESYHDVELQMTAH